MRKEATRKYESWNNGFLFKRASSRKPLPSAKPILRRETAKVEELEEQLRLTTIATHIEVENEQANFYYRLKDEFAAMCECAAIWDTSKRIKQRTCFMNALRPISE